MARSMTAPRTWKTADEIAALFLGDRTDMMLTAKQTRWLLDQWLREMQHVKGFCWNRRTCTGNLTNGGWTLAVCPNGAGVLKARYF